MGTSSRDEGSISRDLQALRRWPRSIRYSLVAVAALALAASGWAFGRSGRTTTSSSGALTAIEAKQREHENRLAALQHEIANAEKRAADARRHAELERCHADAERIDASVAARAAECMREQAAASACHAQNEMTKGKSMRDGCTVGLLAAVLTGGSALLLAGGGCLVGEAAGESKATECPTTTCTDSSDHWMSDAATAVGHAGIPVCGLGVEVTDTRKSLDGGVFVREAYLGAAAAGLTPGDVVVRIGSTRTRTKEDLEVALAGASHGSMIDVDFVRQGALHHVMAQVSTHADDRPEISGPVIGIQYQPVTNVPYVETRVVKVSSDAATTGLMIDDIIQQAGNQMSLRAIDLVRAAATPDGVRLLKLQRKGQPVTLHIGR